jgi:hypothetical protein
MGYVTASKSDGVFTFGTTALDATNTTVAYTNGTLGGSASYYVKLMDAPGNTLHLQGPYDEAGTVVGRFALTIPYVVPAWPNNYVRMSGPNGEIEKGKDGYCLVGYF